MTRIYLTWAGLFCAAVVLLSPVSLAPAAGTAKPSPGEEAFEQYCTVCHPKGENIINAARTLHKKDLEKNGVRNVADIVGKMRNPGPGMTPFDAATIPEATAREIAEYILKTFP